MRKETQNNVDPGQKVRFKGEEKIPRSSSTRLGADTSREPLFAVSRA